MGISAPELRALIKPYERVHSERRLRRWNRNIPCTDHTKVAIPELQIDTLSGAQSSLPELRTVASVDNKLEPKF